MADSTDIGKDRLQQAHLALLRDLGALRETARRPSADGLGELTRRLHALRELVAEHFRLEEQDGYLEAALAREPFAARVADELRQEHCALTAELDALSADAAACKNQVEALRTRAREWVARVRQHEVRENCLVQDAFNLDLAAED
jgi:hypothetical protein